MLPSYNIRCYDPACREDFAFPCTKNASFSSVRHGFFVIEVTPKTGVWESCPSLSSGPGRKTYAHLLSAALKATSSTGFVSVSHMTKRMRKQGVPVIEAGHRLCDSGLGYFEVLPAETDRLLAARQQIQTYEEWIIGGCNQLFSLPEAPSKWYQEALCFGFEFFLQQADRLGCVFYANGETQEDIILVRPWDGAEKFISAFVSSGA